MIISDRKVLDSKDFSFLQSYLYARRAGIIPYLIDKTGKTFVLLGLSNEKTPLWGDLGGRSESNPAKKSYETVLETAIREYGEESRHVLPIFDKNISLIVITSSSDNKGVSRFLHDQVILFVEVDPTEYNVNINKEFTKTIPKDQYEDEMTLLKWIPYNRFLSGYIDKNNLSPTLLAVIKSLKDSA